MKGISVIPEQQLLGELSGEPFMVMATQRPPDWKSSLLSASGGICNQKSSLRVRRGDPLPFEFTKLIFDFPIDQERQTEPSI